MKIALIGNPNSGKTSLFNVLTNSRSKTANFPGVTVFKKEGYLKGNKDIVITDLPGIYSLSPYSPEEKVTADFLEKEKIDLIINIADCTNLGRNLFLTLQLMQYKIPIIVVFNFCDELKKKGITIDFEKTQKMLGVKCVFVSATKNIGIENLIEKIKNPVDKPKMNFKKRASYEEEVDEKYAYIEKILLFCVKEEKTKKKNADIFLTNPFLAYLFFALFVGIIFFFAFGSFGNFFVEQTQSFLDMISKTARNLFEVMNVNEKLTDFVTEGIFKGIFEVLKFVPVFVILFFFLSILEDSGYMARVVFISDYILSKVGLSGKSVIPFLLGYGCNVPAITSTKTIKEDKERKLTAFLLPFIPCGGKTPVFLLIASTFWENGTLFLIFLYMLSLICMFLCGFYFSKSKKYKSENLIMELPEYRVPKMKNIFLNIKEKTFDFIKKVFTVIFLFSVMTYLLKVFTPQFSFTKNPEESILYFFSKSLVFLFKPLGLGNWQIVSSFLCGISAKECVLSTLEVLCEGKNIFSFFTVSQKISFCVFFMFYTPCIGTITSLKKEFGMFFAVKTIVFHTVFAWCLSFVLYNFLCLFT